MTTAVVITLVWIGNGLGLSDTFSFITADVAPSVDAHIVHFSVDVWSNLLVVSTDIGGLGAVDVPALAVGNVIVANLVNIASSIAVGTGSVQVVDI